MCIAGYAEGYGDDEYAFSSSRNPLNSRKDLRNKMGRAQSLSKLWTALPASASISWNNKNNNNII